MLNTRIKIIPIPAPGRARPRLDTQRIGRDLQQAMLDTVVEGQRFIAWYPAQVLTASGYRRTGTLKRSWSKRVSGGLTKIEGIVGSNSNIAPYNREVQGAGSAQAFMFRSVGWRGVDDLARVLQTELDKRVDRVIERIPA